MTLREKQSLFVKLICELILWAYDEGYELTWGEALRSPQEAARLARLGAGILNSLHCDKLAIDLNLFIEGEIIKDSIKHKPIGEKWKTMHPLARWGGDFSDRPDGNHYSFEHDGRK